MYRITFTIHKNEEDRLSDILFSLGAQSISSEKSNVESVKISAIFDSTERVLSHFTSQDMEIAELQEAEWKYAWLENYHGAVVNDDIIILSDDRGETVDETAGKYRYRILLDPRDAFGDGRHPTTVLCMKHLHTLLSGTKREERTRLNLLDAGTGTGILAILASLMGIASIDAFDIEDEAVTKALHNAKINGCGGINIFNADIKEYRPEKKYDLITANVLTEILQVSLPLLASLLAPQGAMIISGISDIWDGEMRMYFQKSGLTVDVAESLEGWNCYVLRISP